MVLHYIYVDSRHKRDDEVVCDFSINLHNPITNVQRVGVQSFTSSNNSHNIKRNNKIVRWIEQKVDGIESLGAFDTKLFEIELPIGYYTINQLLTQITTLMNATTEGKNSNGSVTPRKFNTEANVVYSYSINENYEISILGTSNNTTPANKYWGFYSPVTNMKNSLVHSLLGYEMNAQVTSNRDITNDNKEKFKTTKQTVDVSIRNLKANHSYSENNSLLYLASNVLSSNSISSKNEGHSLMTSQKTNILETIHVNVSRYSFIHLSKFGGDILFHEMDNVSLSHFDLKLLDENYHVNREGVQNYRVVIVVETASIDKREKELMYREYNKQAYELAHRT